MVCVIEFRWVGPVGYSDTMSKICHVSILARAYDCLLVLPRPELLLSAAHNHGQRIGSNVGWERYVDVPAYWRTEAYALALPSASAPLEILDGMATHAQLLNTSSSSTELAATHIVLNYTRGVGLESRFRSPIWPIRGVYRHSGNQSLPDLVYQAVQLLHPGSTPESLRSRYPCELAPSADVLRRRDAAVLACFGERVSSFVALRLRRGDKIREGRYPTPQCAEPPSVVDAVQQWIEAKRVSKEAAANIFVGTDERDAGYLASLRAGLLRVAARVCFEHDLAEIRDAADNYVAFNTVVAMGRAAETSLHFHPSHPEAWRQLRACVSNTTDASDGRRDPRAEAENPSRKDIEMEVSNPSGGRALPHALPVANCSEDAMGAAWCRQRGREHALVGGILLDLCSAQSPYLKRCARTCREHLPLHTVPCVL